jgi:hypothetical protein
VIHQDIATVGRTRVGSKGDLDGSGSLIWINEPTKVFSARAGAHELTTTVLSEDQVRDLVEKMLKSSGRRVDLSAPFVDATLPDGSRLHVVIPDITRRFWSVNIRKFVVRASHLDDLVALGSITAGAARFLDAAVRSGLNVLVSGGTQAGKTTLLNCLAAAVPPQERVVTAEEVFELKNPGLCRMLFRACGRLIQCGGLRPNAADLRASWTDNVTQGVGPDAPHVLWMTIASRGCVTRSSRWTRGGRASRR